jgi:hypothetical protein
MKAASIAEVPFVRMSVMQKSQISAASALMQDQIVA